MRSLILLGQVMLATFFTMPGCGKEGRAPRSKPPTQPVAQTPPGPTLGQIAPEIECEDLDGVTFKLSDYRGKVVVLDFWGQFCGPCREYFPYERSMVRRYKDRPFVLLGVNNDGDLEVAQRSVVKNKINWRSWFDGSPGTIARNWNVEGWPTVYVLDAKGIVRFYSCPVFGREAEIEDIVESLVKVAEAAKS